MSSSRHPDRYTGQFKLDTSRINWQDLQSDDAETRQITETILGIPHEEPCDECLPPRQRQVSYERAVARELGQTDRQANLEAIQNSTNGRPSSDFILRGVEAAVGPSVGPLRDASGIHGRRLIRH